MKIAIAILGASSTIAVAKIALEILGASIAIAVANETMTMTPRAISAIAVANNLRANGANG